MVSILDPLSLRPGGYLVVENQVTGEKHEFDTFTCCHHGGVIAKNPARQRPRYRCKSCMGLACDLPGCSTECRNLIEVDVPLAHRDVLDQPWLLRDAQGYPVDRIVLPDGTAHLIRRDDNGLTSRAMAQTAATERTFLLTCTHCFNRFELAPGRPASQTTCGSCRRTVCEASACQAACPHAPPPGRV